MRQALLNSSTLEVDILGLWIEYEGQSRLLAAVAAGFAGRGAGRPYQRTGSVENEADPAQLSVVAEAGAG